VGIPGEDVVIDCLVMTVGADDQAAAVTIRTIEMVRQAFGVNISLGASNVSFGLPERHVLNQAFLALTAKAGASFVITDAKKLSSIIRAADLMLGRDPNGRGYLKNWRTQEKLAKAASQ
jgi:5-methyltetrahydrofolate--homocysteine methyltransferase